MSPFTKWCEHGRFPYSFAVHAILVPLVTLQLMYFLLSDVHRAQLMVRHFNNLFLGDPGGNVVINRPSEWTQTVLGAIDGCFNINSNSVAVYSQLQDAVPVTLHWHDGHVDEHWLNRTQYVEGGRNYTESVLPIVFAPNGTLLEKLILLTVICSLQEETRATQRSTVWSRLSTIDPARCYDWTVIIGFDGKTKGTFTGSNQYQIVSGCAGGQLYLGAIWFVSVVIIAFSLWSCCLTLLKILRAARILKKLRRAHHQGVQDARLHWREAWSLFNNWWALALAGNVVQIFSSWQCVEERGDISARVAWSGASAFLTWITICQYFEHFPAFYTTFTTMSKGSREVARFLLSILPLYTGFAFLGASLFWQTDFFSSPAKSFNMLFALVNGDTMDDCFNGVMNVSGYIGPIYLYAYIGIFMYVILNVNITIIQEAFYAARFSGLKLVSTELGVHGSRGTQVDPPGTDEALALATLGAVDDPASSEVSGTATFATAEAGATFGGGASPSHRPSRVGRQMSGMSPRFVGNPRLQGALAAAFGESRGESAQPGGPSAAGPDTESSESRELPAFRRSDSSGLRRRGGVGSDAWWSQNLAEWTHLLQTTPLPRRNEVSTERWREIEASFAGLAAAVDEVSSRLWRDHRLSLEMHMEH